MMAFSILQIFFLPEILLPKYLGKKKNKQAESDKDLATAKTELHLYKKPLKLL